MKIRLRDRARCSTANRTTATLAAEMAPLFSVSSVAASKNQISDDHAAHYCNRLAKVCAYLPSRMDTVPVTLKNGTALALVGMALVTVWLLLGFMRDLSSFGNERLPGAMLVVPAGGGMATASGSCELTTTWKSARVEG
jgi:hypothetical protein